MRDPTWLLVGRNAEWWWQAARQHHVRFDSATVCCILMGLSANFAFRVFKNLNSFRCARRRYFNVAPGGSRWSFNHSCWTTSNATNGCAVHRARHWAHMLANRTYVSRVFACVRAFCSASLVSHFDRPCDFAGLFSSRLLLIRHVKPPSLLSSTQSLLSCFSSHRPICSFSTLLSRCSVFRFPLLFARARTIGPHFVALFLFHTRCLPRSRDRVLAVRRFWT